MRGVLTCTRWAGAATHAHAHGTATAQGGVEAEKFHVSWDLSGVLSVTLCRVCVCYPIVWIAALSPLPPPGSAHGAHSRAYTQSESLSVECENAAPVSYCKLSKCHSSYGIVRCPGRGHDRAPVPRGCDVTRCRGREDYKIPQTLWLRFWVKRRLRARSCRLSATLHSQGWCSYERRRAHPRCL